MDRELNLSGLSFAVFNNPVILSSIFTHISGIEGLRQIRLVNKIWWASSLTKWRQTATLRLWWNRAEPMISCLDCPLKSSNPDQYLPWRNTIDIPEFLELVVASEELGEACPNQLSARPFSRYRVGNFPIPDLETDDDVNSDLNRFWNACGAHMKYLYLDHCKIKDNKYADVLRSLLIGMLPSLTELDVVFRSTTDGDPPSDGNIIQDQNFQNNDNFRGHTTLSRFRLERCRTAMFETNHNWEHLPKLFRVVASLKELQLHSEPNMIPIPNSQSFYLRGFNFPLLTKLFLYGETGISFKALRGLPALQTLWIKANNCTCSWNVKVTRGSREFILWPKMEYFHADYDKFTEDSLKILAKWMPNLRKLEIVMGGGTNYQVRRIWPELDELNEITFSSYR